MNVENECEDAKARYHKEKLAGNITHDLIQGGLLDEINPEIDQLDFEESVMMDTSLDCALGDDDSFDISVPAIDAATDIRVKSILINLKSLGILESCVNHFSAMKMRP